jgi:hypothetical protein
LDAGSDIDSYAGLILSYQAMQQPDKARETMARMMEFAQEAGNPAGLPLARLVACAIACFPASLGHHLSTLYRDPLHDTGNSDGIGKINA